KSGTCSAELTTLVTVNVNSAPNTGLTVTAATDPICEGDNTTIDVALSENGYSYQLRNDAGDVNIGAPVVGNGATINLPTGALLATTTFNVLVTNGTCSAELTTLVTVNVTASPNTGLTVTAATDPICEGDNTTIDVGLSENGYSYQLRNDAGDVNVGAPVVGNGGTINLPTGALLATTTFNVLVSNGVCTPIELTTLVTVNVTASPNTGLTVTAATDPICEGDNTTIDVGLSENGYSYQLRNDAGDVNVGAPVVGNGGTINLPTGALLATTTFNVLVSNGVCTPIELTTLVTVNVNAAPDGAITGNIAVCENTSGEVYSVPDAGAGATYAWTVTGGAPVSGAATNSFTVDWATNGGIVEVTITGAAPSNCVTVSNITVTVSATSPPPNGGNNIAESFCQDNALPSLDANTTGTVAWYSDAALTTQIGTGNPFTPTATDLDMSAVGTTTFYVTQDVGCAVSTAIEYAVTILANPDGTITGNSSICENTSGEVYTAPLDATATYAWTLTGGDGIITAGAATNSVTVDWLTTGGDLQITVTGAAPTNCETVSIMAVTVASQPADQAINEANQTICENATVSISLANSENGVTYELFLDGSGTGISSVGDGSANFIVGVLGSAAGLVPAGSPHTIVVQASIGGGCATMLTDNVMVDVTANPLEQTIVEAGNITICESNGQVVTLANSESGVNYEIVLDGLVTSVSAIGTGNANFVVGTLTDAQGLTVGNHIITVQATITPCTIVFTDEIDVTVQNVSAPPTGTSPITECQNGPPPALVVTGTNINWYDDAAMSNPPIATGSPFTPTAAQLDMTVTGSTSFFATQDEGCGESAVIEIQVIVENCSGCYTVDLNLTDATCTDDDGEITLIVGVNGVSPFDFEITNTATGNTVTQNGQPNTTFTFSGVASGNYTYLVRDAAACEVTGSVDIGKVDFKVIATVEKAGDIACFGDPTGGTARITVVGGVNPYQYKVGNDSWTDFASGDVIEGLPVGMDYVILVRDNASDGCPHSSTISISEPAAIEATANKLSDTYPEQDVGSFEVVDIASDFPPYEILLLDGNGDIIIDFLPIEPDRFGNYSYVFDQLTLGAYTAIVKDSTGCEVSVNEILIESKTDITIPNVFTPNNDGYNEAFIILNKKADTKLVVVNRWGVKVFDAIDYQNDWRAEGVPDGIYFYTISMDGQIYNGSVEVWRGGAKINN
ncbi:MAG: gliding motility-associated C-terminal domain-containing protein, partial [Cyclobacteriaceae bacterium]|nr:gliding motility-associated C-terminal domain-containing protein [Cyclobacteriaceae bacterium]